ncbi:MAG: gas vesicle protein [Chloroflexaceae bacterium]|jgi:hypothetical protein|nr:gas vesicle protein [Chloroflexaceae bacterium]
MNGPTIARLAKEQLSELTGLTPDTVSKLSKDTDGWHVAVEMIEVKRIPNTSDVLATYETLLDPEGNLVSYIRTQRYYRSQVKN